MKKVLALALALMMLLSVFAFAEEDFSGTITVSLYSSTGTEEAWNAVGEAYEALHPGVDVVVDLKPSDSYTDWVKAMFQSYEETLPEVDLVYGNHAGTDRTNKTINFLDYIGEESPYSDCEDWTEQFAFEMQNIESGGTNWDCLSISGVQVLWFYNVEIFEKVGVEPPKTWDEFADVCAKIQEAGYQPLAVAGDFQSFWAEQMGWLAQVYADQTTRSQIEIVRAQEGDAAVELTGLTEFGLGAFAMPSMEGEGMRRGSPCCWRRWPRSCWCARSRKAGGWPDGSSRRCIAIAWRI